MIRLPLSHDGQGALTIALEPPDRPELTALVEELDAYLATLYPPESNHGIDIAALSAPNVLFAVARLSGAAAGCGALVLGGEAGATGAELKRMYVRPDHRGWGIGKAILSFLETEAMARGIRTIALETGIHQPEALGLYERAGYGQCPPFGRYVADPLSVFMQKSLDPDE